MGGDCIGNRRVVSKRDRIVSGDRVSHGRWELRSMILLIEGNQPHGKWNRRVGDDSVA